MALQNYTEFKRSLADTYRLSDVTNEKPKRIWANLVAANKLPAIGGYLSQQFGKDWQPADIRLPGIYYIHNLRDDKGYVGLGSPMLRRVIWNHLANALVLDHRNQLQKDIYRYGPKNFALIALENPFVDRQLDRFWQLDQYERQRQLKPFEREWIIRLDTRSPNGYNKAP